MPTDAEWTVLTDYLGGEGVAGGKLKEAGFAHWYDPNSATNETGFTALPGGSRSFGGRFDRIRAWGIWWSSTEASTSGAWGQLMDNNAYVVSVDFLKQSGYSVRCLRD